MRYHRYPSLDKRERYTKSEREIIVREQVTHVLRSKSFVICLVNGWNNLLD